MTLRYARAFFHALLWACSVVLLGLTAYRIHYTKRRNVGDILTFPDRLLCFVVLMKRLRAGGLGSFLSEALYLFIIMVMFLVGAAYTTVRRLTCRSVSDSYPPFLASMVASETVQELHVCRILETIKVFSFICFGLTVLMLLWTLIDLMTTKSSWGDSAAGGFVGGARRSKGYSDNQTYPVARNASGGLAVLHPISQDDRSSTDSAWKFFRPTRNTEDVSSVQPSLHAMPAHVSSSYPLPLLDGLEPIPESVLKWTLDVIFAGTILEIAVSAIQVFMWTYLVSVVLGAKASVRNRRLPYVLLSLIILSFSTASAILAAWCLYQLLFHAVPGPENVRHSLAVLLNLDKTLGLRCPI
ncbi:hypothetical protein BKA70DRAFT_1449821 [Coprinopsis sp. MPI-PUGE-AT-0042]|nr:hypothetical protein BKA70DRAFT_1449821 [Coprinopsis sp. MPI-PUGE-AT-0042]